MAGEATAFAAYVQGPVRATVVEGPASSGQSRGHRHSVLSTRSRGRPKAAGSEQAAFQVFLLTRLDQIWRSHCTGQREAQPCVDAVDNVRPVYV